MPYFLTFALLAGIGLSLIAGPIGCFVVWRRMSYFGDSLAHSSLLGVAVGLLLNIDLTIASIIITVIFALLLTLMSKKHSDDTILGILAHSGLAISIVILSFSTTIRVDLTSYLFGDILAVNKTDLAIIGVLIVIFWAWLYFNWRKLLLITINKNLAIVDGINVKLTEAQFIVLLSIIVATSIKIFGILLITAMLIIPAATAKFISKNPRQMAFFATIFSIFSVIIGLLVSLYVDIPSGPSIIVSSLGFFILFSASFRKQNVL